MALQASPSTHDIRDLLASMQLHSNYLGRSPQDKTHNLDHRLEACISQWSTESQRSGSTKPRILSRQTCRTASLPHQNIVQRDSLSTQTPSHSQMSLPHKLFPLWILPYPQHLRRRDDTLTALRRFESTPQDRGCNSLELQWPEIVPKDTLCTVRTAQKPSTFLLDTSHI